MEIKKLTIIPKLSLLISSWVVLLCTCMICLGNWIIESYVLSVLTGYLSRSL